MSTSFRSPLAALLLAGATLAACADAEPDAGVIAEGAVEEVTFAPELGVDPAQLQQTESGLRYQELQPGTGETAEPGDPVVVHYTGWLPSGETFDSSVERGEPFTFTLGQGEVIEGWDEGVAGMQVGGRRRLVIPPGLAYGAEGAGGVIPPNATLVFDVELLEVR